MTGLIGKSLKHSISKQIHAYFGNSQYEYIELENLNDFNSLQGIGYNVTIPYKEQIIPYLSKLEGIAIETKSVNTIVKKNDEWIGYNTDYDGFNEMLNHYDIHLDDKKVIILGNGGASKSITYLCNQLKANYIILCRNPKNNRELTIDKYTDFLDYDVVINTTPVGMYPHNEDMPLIDLSKFTQLTEVIDIIYNPIRTSLLVQASQLKIKNYNGLYMLVAQAAKAHELFFGEKIKNELINQIEMNLRKMMYNIVLIGLPLSGKSKYASLLCEITNKKLIDTDSIIETEKNMKISDIFEKLGETSFREYELDLTNRYYKSLKMVISTGGGMVLNDEIMNKLSQNGLVFFLDKHPDKVSGLIIKNRPLIQNSSDIYKLYEDRYPKYLKYADIVIKIDNSTEYHLKEIEEKLNEYLSH